MAGRSSDRAGPPPPETASPSPGPPARPRPPPRADSGIASDARLFEELLTEDSAGTPGLNTEWLYEVDGQVFGPLTTRVLLQRLYDGTLSPETPVALEDGEFRAIRRIGAFRAHLPRVAAHQARLAEARAAAAAEARRRLIRRLTWLGSGLVVVAMGSLGVIALVRYQREAEASAARKAQQAALRAELDALMARVTIEPPLEALVEEAPPVSHRRRRRSRSASRVVTPGAKGVLTRREITRGVARAFGGFKRCIVQQIQRDPSSVGPEILLTFSVGNDGRARDVSFGDRFLRRSSMLPCFETQLSKVRWRTFRGEVRNVEYPISVRR